MDINIADKIKTLRTNQKLSMNQLAKKSGISQAFISGLESGNKQPTVDTLERLCTALGITLVQFFQCEENKSDLPPHLEELLYVAKNLSIEDTKNLTKLLNKVKV